MTFFFVLVAALLAASGIQKGFDHVVGTQSSIESETTEIALRRALIDIKRELKVFGDTPGRELGLELTGVEIELLIGESSRNSSSVELVVPVFSDNGLGTQVEQFSESGSKITILLAPPQGSQTLSAPEQSVIQFSQLLSAIRETLRDVLKSEPVLIARAVEVELNFVLVTEASASAGVQAKVVTVSAGRAWARTNSNRITLSYVNPAFDEERQQKVEPP